MMDPWPIEFFTRSSVIYTTYQTSAFFAHPHPTFCFLFLFFKFCINKFLHLKPVLYIHTYLVAVQIYKMNLNSETVNRLCLNETQTDVMLAAMTVCFFLPVVFFFGRTTFIGSGAVDELDEG